MDKNQVNQDIFSVQPQSIPPNVPQRPVLVQPSGRKKNETIVKELSANIPPAGTQPIYVQQQQTVIISEPRFSNGLFGCFNDFGICLKAFFIPCWSVYDTQVVLDQTKGSILKD